MSQQSSRMTDTCLPKANPGDLVLREVRRIKDKLSASYGHDVDELFAGARKRQALSGHRIVNLQVESKTSSESSYVLRETPRPSERRRNVK